MGWAAVLDELGKVAESHEVAWSNRFERSHSYGGFSTGMYAKAKLNNTPMLNYVLASV